MRRNSVLLFVAAIGLLTGAPGNALEAAVPTADVAFSRVLNLPLSDLGVNEPIRLQGRERTRGVAFSIRSDEVVTSAKLKLRLAYSPNLDASRSQLSTLLNGETVHSMILNPVDGTTDTVEVDISPYVFLPDNDLVFSLTAARIDATESCANPADESIWLQVSNGSALELGVYRIGMESDLSQLPLPFFDRRDATELQLPFVFAERASLAAIEASAILASHWGKLAAYRGASFPVHLNELPSGNAIVFATEGQQVGGINPGRITGPTVSLMANPSGQHGQLLLILGRNAAELATAARAVALGEVLLTGRSSVVTEPDRAPRKPYDAPGWVTTDRRVTLGELIDSDALEGRGISPGVLTVPFQTAPDIFLWGSQGIPVTVRYRYPGSQWLDLESSRLDVLINDHYVDSVPLGSTDTVSLAERFVGADYAMSTATVRVPPFNVFGQNQLQFYYDLHPRVDDPCADALPAELRAAIDPTTTIDLTGVHRYTRMPNLAFLAQAGFPFTRMADLSETAIVMPDQLGVAEIQTVLNVMGAIGAKTGYPATGIELVGARDVAKVADHDLLVIGTYEQQPLFREWQGQSPVTVSGSVARVQLRPVTNALAAGFSFFSDQPPSADVVSMPVAATAGILSSFESPMSPGRTVVAIMAPHSEALVKLSDVLRSSELSPQLQGDLAVVSGDSIDSHRVANPYYVGELPTMVYVQWYLSERPWIVSMLMLLGVLLISLSVFRLMKTRALKRGIEVTS
jgi:hypothetical protein